MTAAAPTTTAASLEETPSCLTRPLSETAIRSNPSTGNAPASRSRVAIGNALWLGVVASAVAAVILIVALPEIPLRTWRTPPAASE